MGVVRRMYALLTDRGAWRRGEYDQVFLEYCSADYELIPPPIYPDAATSLRGLEGVREWQRLMDEIWVDWDFSAEHFFDAGDQVFPKPDRFEGFLAIEEQLGSREAPLM